MDSQEVIAVEGESGDVVVPSEPVEVVATVEFPPRLFMTTPLDDYTVTEGLLLFILFALLIGGILKFLGRYI